MGHRDYGQTSSVLLANQQQRFEARLRAAGDKNFQLADLLAREQNLRARLEGFLREKGLLDQWQCEEDSEVEAEVVTRRDGR